MTREEELQQFAEQNTKGLYLDRHNLIQMVKQGAEWADQHPHWIPVEEELPKLTIDGWRSEDVFFATDDGKSHFGFYSNKGVWFSSVYGFNGHQVTHWMPLPEAPRKEE